MGRRTLDAFIFVAESFDSDALLEDLEKNVPDSVVLFSDGKKTWYGRQPTEWPFTLPPIRLFHLPNDRLDYIFHPIVHLVNQCSEFLYFVKLGLRYKVHCVIVKSAYTCAYIGILRRLNLFGRLVFFAGDWFQGNKTRRGIWSRFNSNVLHPLCDYIACRLSDLTLNQGEIMRGVRVSAGVHDVEFRYDGPLKKLVIFRIAPMLLVLAWGSWIAVHRLRRADSG